MSRRKFQFKNWPTDRLHRRKSALVTELSACARANSAPWRTLPLERELEQLNDALVGRAPVT